MNPANSFIFILIVLQLQAPGYAQSSGVKAPTDSPRYKHHTFITRDDITIDYWFMSPAKIESGIKYPLVLALHGAGGNTGAAGALGSDTLRKGFPCFVMAPAINSSTNNWAIPKGIDKKNRISMLPVVFEALDELVRKYPIDADRIYVTGQSMGAVGTFGAISIRPDFFAAAIPIAGGWNPDDAPVMKDIPVWVFHGDQDRTVKVDYSRIMVAAIREAGGEPEYTEYEGVGHDSWTKTYKSREVWEWLFAQRKNQ